ncbi:hypothetical protein [Pseudotamlana agarivorans]|uniref:hypothetical protein n=1 Tax=Pseudotamlana agarivorans TaxID=481183 RepID=UPI0008364050|nr:hypothetical protein [Tamlana agarivorans]
MKTKLELGVYRFFNEANKTFETIILTRGFNKFYWSVNKYKTLDFSVLKKGLFGKRKTTNKALELNFFKNEHHQLKGEILSVTSFKINDDSTPKIFKKENNLKDLNNKEITLKSTLFIFIAACVYFIYALLIPYFNASLENQHTSTEIPIAIEVLTTKNTFVTSRGVGKLRFPVIKEEEQVSLYVKTKNNLYKTRYYNALGEKLQTVLPLENITDQKINFDVKQIEKIKTLYNNSNEITELRINNVTIKTFKERKMTSITTTPVLVVSILLLGFIYLLIFLWNEP